jgi:hypothetical protein
MAVLCLLLIVAKCIGDGYGIIVSLSIMKSEYLKYDKHPYFRISQLVLGISASLDMIFSIIGSIGFLYALGGGENNKVLFIAKVLLKHDGYRLIVISILHMFICAFAVYVSGGNEHTYITHIGIYIPSWVYALELRTFLDLSFVAARDIILEQGKKTLSYTSQNNSIQSDYSSRVSVHDIISSYATKSIVDYVQPIFNHDDDDNYAYSDRESSQANTVTNLHLFYD